MSVEVVEVSAFYVFVAIEESKINEIRERLVHFASTSGVKGLVVLGTEGINATIAGDSDIVSGFHRLVQELIPGVSYPIKTSHAEKAPFVRFKVDLRPEIVTIKDLEIEASESKGTYLSPTEWHKMITSDPDVVLVDARNEYETEIGMFEGAIDPKIKKFSDFGSYVEAHGLPKDKKLFLYCTGGIRCEKAVPEVKRLGYDNVYQLEGGILRYLEEYPQGYFKGECFVFDRRVSLDAELRPSRVYKLCPHCGNPGKDSIVCTMCGLNAVVCHRCIERADLNTCSKNCAHHARRRAAAA